jgi:cytochrome c553
VTRILAIAIVMVGLMSMIMSATAAAADVTRGESTYKELCAGCHGAGGKGGGKEAAALASKPKDLADCQRMTAFPDERLFRIIKEGGSAGGLSDAMPQYSSSLEDDEIRDVIGYIRSWCQH